MRLNSNAVEMSWMYEREMWETKRVVWRDGRTIKKIVSTPLKKGFDILENWKR